MPECKEEYECTGKSGKSIIKEIKPVNKIVRMNDRYLPIVNINRYNKLEELGLLKKTSLLAGIWGLKFHG